MTEQEALTELRGAFATHVEKVTAAMDLIAKLQDTPPVEEGDDVSAEISEIVAAVKESTDKLDAVLNPPVEEEGGFFG